MEGEFFCKSTNKQSLSSPTFSLPCLRFKGKTLLHLCFHHPKRAGDLLGADDLRACEERRHVPTPVTEFTRHSQDKDVVAAKQCACVVAMLQGNNGITLGLGFTRHKLRTASHRHQGKFCAHVTTERIPTHLTVGMFVGVDVVVGELVSEGPLRAAVGLCVVAL